MLGREVNLKAIFAGVTGARDQRAHAVHVALKKMVILQRSDRLAREASENSERLGSLNGELRIALSGVFDLRVEAAPAGVADVFEVFILIAGVHAKEVMTVGNLVDEQIVDERSRGSHQAGVLRLAIDELRGVVARDELDPIKRLRTAHFDLAH